MSGMREIASIASMRCGDCGVLVRTFTAQTAHSIGRLHNNWTFCPVEVRGLYCASCDARCGSERVADGHTRKTGHGEFVVKNPVLKSKVKEKAADSSSSRPGDVLQELAPPAVDSDLLSTLTGMGYSQESASRAIVYCGPISVDGLVEWLTVHKDDPDIEKPILVPTMPKWTNLITNEMKIRSQKLREHAVWKANQRKEDGSNTTVRITLDAPVLYTRRLLEYVETLSSNKREELKQIYIIVQDMEGDEVVKKIDKALEECNPALGEFSFKLPSRSESAYVFDTDLMQICLLRDKTYTCSTKSKKHRLKARRIGSTMLLVKRLIQRGEAIRLRWVYYLEPLIYGNQDNSNEALAAMSLICEGTRSSFHIRPSPRGSIVGPILLCVDDTIMVNCTLGTVSGSKIPSEAESINRIIQVSTIDFILIVEKDTVFHKLSDMDFPSQFNCVMVTASGEPDVATRIVLHKLHRWLDVPVCALVDANSEGFDILSTYKFGSVNTLPDLNWIGVFPEDVDEKDLVPMGTKELNKLRKTLGKLHVTADIDWRTGLMNMLQASKKADIEAVARNCRLDEYIMRRVRPLLT